MAIHPDGSIIVADRENHVIRRVTTDGHVTTIAGIPGQSGFSEGAALNSKFSQPEDVVFAQDGTLFVADSGNHQVRHIDTSGNVLTFAGDILSRFGNTDAAGVLARFTRPSGMCIDSLANLYVAESQPGPIRKISPERAVTTLAGKTKEESGKDFFRPFQIAFDPSGDLYVTDLNLILKISSLGEISTYAGQPGSRFGDLDGGADTARLHAPDSLAFDQAGNLYFIDRSALRKVSVDGTVETIAGSTTQRGYADGYGEDARFHYPYALAVTADSTVFILDGLNQVIRKVTPEGNVSTFAGKAGVTGAEDGVGEAARFNYPKGMVYDGSDCLYVADTDNHTIRKIEFDGTVTTFAGRTGVDSLNPNSWDGKGTDATLNSPAYMAIDQNGNLLVSHNPTSSVIGTFSNAIRTITPAGVTSTITAWRSTDSHTGLGSDAAFRVRGMAVHPDGRIFISDSQARNLMVGTLAQQSQDLFIENTDENSRAMGSATVSFGSIPVGASMRQTFRLWNSGGDSLQLNSLIQGSGDLSDFMVSSLDTAPLPPGASTSIQVTFTPTKTGSRGASLVISSDDPDGPEFTLNLHGVGEKEAIPWGGNVGRGLDVSFAKGDIYARYEAREGWTNHTEYSDNLVDWFLLRDPFDSTTIQTWPAIILELGVPTTASRFFRVRRTPIATPITPTTNLTALKDSFGNTDWHALAVAICEARFPDAAWTISQNPDSFRRWFQDADADWDSHIRRLDTAIHEEVHGQSGVTDGGTRYRYNIGKNRFIQVPWVQNAMARSRVFIIASDAATTNAVELLWQRAINALDLSGTDPRFGFFEDDFRPHVFDSRNIQEIGILLDASQNLRK